MYELYKSGVSTGSRWSGTVRTEFNVRFTVCLNVVKTSYLKLKLFFSLILIFILTKRFKMGWKRKKNYFKIFE